MSLTISLKKGSNGFSGYIGGVGNYLPGTQADTIENVIANLRTLINDYKAHEGANDKVWNKINPDSVEFELAYDLTAFFESYSVLKISAIAARAGMNESLVRHYARGNKSASLEQVKRIESAVRDLGRELSKVELIS